MVTSGNVHNHKKDRKDSPISELYGTGPGTRDQSVTLRETVNRRLAEKAAAEGMVLLKNEGHFLPLEPGTKVALYGAGASMTVKGGTGSGDVNERESVSIYQGMKDAGL